ncbi:hypothetical protein TIFTF001_033741 [Ficus carica]|uniref:Uncharacterized protein n=1 Tax=Ficus carica TaxID=3494 RepID=A0AA88DYS8_FICCA|nr:hypothetical protein TIFTF001_033741 [Ficus carica]
MRVSSKQDLTCIMALSKWSKYPFKGSSLPCLILNKYDISFFRVLALRNAVEKPSDHLKFEHFVYQSLVMWSTTSNLCSPQTIEHRGSLAGYEHCRFSAVISVAGHDERGD